MTRGTITNKQTGLEITGKRQHIWGDTFDFRIDGVSAGNIFRVSDWDYTPEPEPIRNGVYMYRGMDPALTRLRKHVAGEWRDADGYALANQNVDVSELVRLVPEA